MLAKTTYPTVELEDLVSTVEQFGEASRELIAWEFSLPESALAEVWTRALKLQLIRYTRRCDETHERLFVAVSAAAR